MAVEHVARVDVPTPQGVFQTDAFECSSGHVYLALSMGELRGDAPPLVRVHSECLTGDALGSLRCDCGIQLRSALRAIAAERRGVLVYATGHEGRGIGLVNKLRAYVAQDQGADTVDANLHLGLPADGRSYADAAEVLKALGAARVRLMTNSPAKSEALQAHGIEVTAIHPVHVAAHHRNARYLQTKRTRFSHAAPEDYPLTAPSPPDAGALMGEVGPRGDRPYVVVKYAQSVDGRIATAGGDSKWISGTAERTISHALRARCDAVMVGVGTVVADDPHLTVRLVSGASPIRVVLDSRLTVPESAKVLDDEAATILLTTARAAGPRIERMRQRDITVHVAPAGDGGVDLEAAMKHLRALGIRSLLVEGGARVITSLLACDAVDRLIVGCAPRILGAGVEGVGDLGTARVAEGIALENRCLQILDDDVLMAWDVRPPGKAARPSQSLRSVLSPNGEVRPGR